MISLSEAIERIGQDSLPDNAVVITMDDGWYGVHAFAMTILNKFSLPATLYATTYYSQKTTMVFNVALRYMLEKSPGKTLDCIALECGLTEQVNLSRHEERNAIMRQLNDLANHDLSAKERQNLLSRVARNLGLDFDEMYTRRMFTLLTSSELKQASNDGLDIQLHTHRHKSSDNGAEVIEQEIQDNRAVLEPLLKSSQNHFCYPSGIVNHDVILVMQRLGIKSAVTCEAGLNYKGQNPLLLSRFLDGSDIPQLVFEAEMSGVLELGRRFRAKK